MKKTTRVAAKMLAGVAVAAAIVVGSTAPAATSASDFGWFSVHAGQTVSAGHVISPNSDFGWF